MNTQQNKKSDICGRRCAYAIFMYFAVASIILWDFLYSVDHLYKPKIDQSFTESVIFFFNVQ